MLPSFTIHRAGWPIILGFILITLILFSFSLILGGIGLLLTIWCIYFFRDPVRMVPQGDSFVVSPADGLIQSIEQASMPKELELEGTFLKISIFLNVFDVHVNRTPLEGVLVKSIYHPGQFLNASFDKASELNERHSYLLRTTYSKGKSRTTADIAFVQIAGLVARRIVSEVEVGDHLGCGQRIGIIRFGSRVDVYLPQDCSPIVAVGQRVVGGETILADLNLTHSERTFVEI